MIRYAVETAQDASTGLDCYIVVDTHTCTSVDRAYDKAYAQEICDYYNDREVEYLYVDSE